MSGYLAWETVPELGSLRRGAGCLQNTIHIAVLKLGGHREMHCATLETATSNDFVLSLFFSFFCSYVFFLPEHKSMFNILCKDPMMGKIQSFVINELVL